MFSSFADPKLYGGCVPSGKFLQEVYIDWCQSVEPFFDTEVCVLQPLALNPEPYTLNLKP